MKPLPIKKSVLTITIFTLNSTNIELIKNKIDKEFEKNKFYSPFS